MQKSQLVDEAALWKKTGSRRHWILRVESVLSVGLSPAADADRPCLERLALLSAAFTAADLRTHTLCNYFSFSTAKAGKVVCEMVNHDG